MERIALPLAGSTESNMSVPSRLSPVWPPLPNLTRAPRIIPPGCPLPELTRGLWAETEQVIKPVL